jgi:hypothetical protein
MDCERRSHVERRLRLCLTMNRASPFDRRRALAQPSDGTGLREPGYGSEIYFSVPSCCFS